MPDSLARLAGADETMTRLARRAARFAQRDLPVLIRGETGTGKEVMARAIHAARAVPGPFVAVNCAAIPEHLIESELFGYAPNAFTGAAKGGKRGLIEAAHGGTLFLDEIGDMPLALQSRLLRVLAERCVTPVGALESLSVDIHLISATHAPLADRVATGAFREDLYYRLNAAVLKLPPQMYARVMELNFWGSTEAKRASYDENTQTWTVVVEHGGEEITLHPKQLVLVTGMSAKPNRPTIAGQDRFQGIQQHSSGHPGPDGMEGKLVVVIGSNNSAHDICAALAEHGVDATMVQRSSTHISRSESLMKHALGPLYSEEAVANGITTEKADLLFASIPYALMADFQKPIFDAIRAEDAEFYRQLEDAGFMLDFGPDDSGLFMKYLRRASGYYIDVGASQLIIDGRIKLASGADAKELTEHSVVLEDGRELPADVVIYATGYGLMNGWAADLISQEVADKVGKVWGLGSDTPKDPGPWEGEQRNMWKPTRQEGLWFHGGNLAQSRHYSHYLALQLKARMEGIPTPVYGPPKTHHLS